MRVPYSPLDNLLYSLYSRGSICLLDSIVTKLHYDPRVWIEVAQHFEDRPQTLAEKYWLLYEGILSHDDGEQYTEHEATEFLLKCAYGKEFLTNKYYSFCERYVRENHEDKLIERIKD